MMKNTSENEESFPLPKRQCRPLTSLENLVSEGPSTSGSRKPLLTIAWQIVNISLMEEEESPKGVESPVYRCRALGGKRFKLQFWPKGKDGKDSRVALKLGSSHDHFDYAVDCRWSFHDSNGSVLAGGFRPRYQVKPFIYDTLPNCPTYEEVFVTSKLKFLQNDTLTVQCHIWKSNEDVAACEFISGRTELESLEHSFVWPIHRCSTLVLGQEVTTPVTLVDCGRGDNFQMNFSFRGESLTNSSAHIKLVPCAVPVLLRVMLKLSILDQEQRVVRCVESRPQLFRPGIRSKPSEAPRVRLRRVLEAEQDQISCPNFLTRREVLMPHNSSSDIFVLNCEISAFKTSQVINKNKFRVLDSGLLNADFSRTGPDPETVRLDAIRDQQRMAIFNSYIRRRIGGGGGG